MALMAGGIYDALLAAGAPQDKARAAAEGFAARDVNVHDLKRDIALLKWMVGTGVVLQLGTLGAVFTFAINRSSFT